MIIGKVYSLDKYEQAIVKLSAEQRHNNKIKTGWDGSKTVNPKSELELNIVGFGGEFIFARENNLYPDFKIHNTCLLYTSPSPRDRQKSRMPSSA